MESISLPQLAVELGVSQPRLREWIRSMHGSVAEDLIPWGVSGLIADSAKSHFSAEARLHTLEWALNPGDTVRRRAIHRTYGGQRQGGISTPRASKEILIFTNPEAGARFGYDQHEGLHEDGSYSYTGEGQRGDQTHSGGNRAILDADSNGRTIRLFRTHNALATYVGAFQTDTPPFNVETIPDVDGMPRQGIIFNLIPISARTELLPAYGGELPSAPVMGGETFQLTDWQPPESTDLIFAQGGSLPVGDRVVSRVEFALQRDFGAWLAARGTPAQRLRLRSGSTQIEPDFYVPDENWVVEAKKSPARDFVRMAVGQVLDYVHVAKKAGLASQPVVLLPGKPEQDLLDLLHAQRISLITQEATTFVLLRN